MISETVALPKNLSEPTLKFETRKLHPYTASTKRQLPSTASNQWIFLMGVFFKGQKLRLEEHLPDRS